LYLYLKDKILIFSEYTQALLVLKTILAQEEDAVGEREVLLLHGNIISFESSFFDNKGGLTDRLRAEVLAEARSMPSILLVTIALGGVGLTLTEFSVVSCIIENWYFKLTL